MEPDRKKPKRKYAALRILGLATAVVLIVLMTVLLMSTHTPGRYQPAAADTNQVSPYLTHYLAPGFYNNIQLDEPFELVVEQKGLNEIIADGSLLDCQWPVDLNGVTFQAPAIALLPETIMLMGTVNFADLPIVMTIVLKPKIDEAGSLYLNFQSVKAGVLDITFLAKIIAKKVFAAQIQATDGQDNEWLKNLSAAVLENKPFDPVFPAYEKKIRLTKAKFENAKVILTFTPE